MYVFEGLINDVRMLIYAPLVSGTLRSNLDPFGQHDDARLWDALKRSYLVESEKAVHEDDGPEGARTPVNRFSLDSIVEDEGNNLSIGQVRRSKLAQPSH